MSSIWTDCMFSSMGLFLLSKEPRRSYVIGSPSFSARYILQADSQSYCYTHNVAHLLRILIEVFLRREETWLQQVCLLSALSQRCFWRSWQLCSVTLCGCACVRVCQRWGCFPHSYQRVLGEASAPAFFQKRNLLSFMCLGQKKKKSKSKRRRV